MRIPRALSPKFQKQMLLKYGVYQKVFPCEITPSRPVPEYIPRPDYVLNKDCYRIPIISQIKDSEQIIGMKRSCKLASSILSQVENLVKPGITTDDIDEYVHNLIIEAGAYPSPLNYKGFPKSICTSVNNVAVHGIPDLRPLEDGDMLNVDITVFYKGFHGDCSKMFIAGNVDEKGRQLIGVTEECLHKAINLCGPGVPFCEIGSQIQRHAKRYNITVIPAVIGHGIGEYFHGPPDIYHCRNNYPGVMQSGMTFTIEPVLSHGSEDTVMLEDNWTVVTEDGARTAQLEHTVLITDNGAEILT